MSSFTFIESNITHHTQSFHLEGQINVPGVWSINITFKDISSLLLIFQCYLCGKDGGKREQVSPVCHANASLIQSFVRRRSLLWILQFSKETNVSMSSEEGGLI